MDKMRAAGLSLTETGAFIQSQFLVASLGMAAVMLLASGVSSGQHFPSKSIRMVTAEAGGSPDFVSRVIAQGIAAPLGQPVVIENRSSGLIPADIVSKATPDGYTLLVTSNVLWIQPLMQKVPYDPARDFSPVTFTNKAPLVVGVHPSVAASSIKELIALAKAKPGTLNYASSVSGTASHLAGELLKSMTGIDIVRVPYKGAALAIGDLLSGRVQLTFFTGTSVMPHVKTGKLRALAVTSSQPSALYPELPTVAASGLPGYEAGSIYGIFAPAHTSHATIMKLNQAAVRYLDTREAREKFLSSGSEASPSTPAHASAMMKWEMARMGKVISEAGIKAE